MTKTKVQTHAERMKDLTFILIYRGFYKTYEWWRITSAKEIEIKKQMPEYEIKLYNYANGYNSLLSDDVIIEVLEHTSWETIYSPECQAKTSLYKNLRIDSTDKTIITGWLSPDGQMHYCKYNDHITYVHLILNSEVSTIEAQGWLHISKHDNGEPFYFTPKRKMTQAQANALKKMGSHVHESDVLYQ
jgi:hypothetical protein